LIGVGISGLFIWLTLRKVPLSEVWAETAKVHLGILALTLVTKLGGFVCMTYRSSILFKPFGDFRLWRLFKSILVAFVGNNVLPLRAGELLRVGYLTHNHEASGSSGLAAVALERLLDMFTLAILFLLLVMTALIDVSHSYVPTQTAIWMVCSVVFAAMLGALVMSRYPEPFVNAVDATLRVFSERLADFVTARVERFATGLAGLTSWRQTLMAILLSFGYWASGVASVWVWIQAFGLEVPWHASLVVAVFTAFATVIPSSPGFVGTYHFFVKTAIGFFGVASATAASFAIVGHAAAMLPFTLIGILILLGDWLRGDLTLEVDDEFDR
jgi:uncharacterized protein (TIRG00374 family)